jgi:DNA-binding LacI/PurR family transcriptional regulator
MSKISVVTIAKKCGVSPSTVCRALNSRSDINENTRSKILEVCQKFGYSKNQAASNLRLKQSNVIICLMPDMSNELFIEKLFFLKTAVRNAGFSWLLKSYSDTAEAYELLRSSVSSRPAGIIISFFLTDELNDLLINNRVPVIGYDCRCENIDSVTQDRTQGSFEAVTYLLEQSRTEVLLLGAGLDCERGRGYQLACEKREIAVDDKLIIDIPFGRNLFKYGYDQMKSLYGKVKFDAIFAVNDAAAIGACKALTEMGVRIPEEVAVVGFDDIMVSQFSSPALTTFTQPKEIMADYCVKFLVNRIKDFDCSRQSIMLNMSLVVRES